MHKLLLVVLLGFSLSSASQTPDETADKIVGAAMLRGGASAFLESLADGVGGRVTGSAESKAASELILRTLQEAGFTDAHFEEYSIEAGWTRGPIDVHVVRPVRRRIFAGAYGWVPGTRGAVEVPVVGATLGPDGKLAGDVSRFSGAAVLVDLHLPGTTSWTTDYVVIRADMAKQLGAAGAAAMMIISDKPDRMVYTSAFGFYPRGPLPVLSVAKEDGLALQRLLAHGPVTISLNVQNTFQPGPITERNVVAEIPGINASEIVLLGAHFDSWDPADGANDNGSGVAALVAAARALKYVGVRPQRTIRFVFFSGEEQACLGSRAYVAKHNSELDNHRVAIIMDDGAQAPLGFRLNRRADLEPAVQRIISPLAPLSAAKVFPGGDAASDHVAFIAEGVPALALNVEEGAYDVHHHAITDTIDKIDPQMLALDSAVMALAAYSFANAKETPGRRLSPDEVRAYLRDSGFSGGFALLYGPGKP